MNIETVPFFTEKQLNSARKTHIFNYMVNRGEEFESIGRYWRHTKHDSFDISKKTGVAKWRSRGISSYDNAIEMICEFYQEPYGQVVQQLLDFNSGERSKEFDSNMQHYQKEENKEKEHFDLARLNVFGNYDTKKLSERGRSYLRSRFLSEETIREFEEKNLISSDNKGNILFKIGGHFVGSQGVPAGAVIQGTYSIPLEKRISTSPKTGEMVLGREYYKGIALNSQPNRGFLFGYVSDRTVRPTLYVTEAPIESLSLLEMVRPYQTKNTWYLSLNGLKDQTLWSTVDQLKELFPDTKGMDIVLALNNDEKGREAITRLHSTFKNEREMNKDNILRLMLPPIEDGDWNEVLEQRKTGSLSSRVVKEQDRKKARQLFNERKQVHQQAQQFEVLE